MNTQEQRELPEKEGVVPRIFFWNEAFETGLSEVDRQHRGLIDLINRIPRLSVGLEADGGMSDVFAELMAYAADHFATEEALWEALPRVEPVGPLFDRHEEEHRDFVRKVAEIRRAEHPVPMMEVVAFLTHWLARHILESDRRMAFVLEGIGRGLSPEEALSEAEARLDLASTFTRAVLSMYDAMVEQSLLLLSEMERRKAAEGSLRLMGKVFESVRDAILLLSPDGTVVDANPAFCRKFLCRRDEIPGHSLFMEDPARFDPATLAKAFREALESGHFSGTIQAFGKDGETETLWLSLSSVKDENGEVSCLTATFAPMGALLDELRSLSKEAHHDPLTGLANRRAFSEDLERLRIESLSGGTHAALVLIDLDRFKAVNDLRGHPAGDQVLVEVARRMRETVRQSDLVYRLGGDEFAIILSGLSSDRVKAFLEARGLGEKIRAALGAPYEVTAPLDGDRDGTFCHECPPSLGIRLFGPNPRDTLSTIFGQADQALYRAKRAGGNRVVFPEKETVSKTDSSLP